MTALRAAAGRSRGKIAVVGAMLATAGGSLLLLTEFPTGIAPGAGASAALSELAARSPGMRIGGVALKAKKKRAAPIALAKAAPAKREAVPGLGNAPLASVMSAGPASPVSGAPAGLGTFPGDLITPGGAAPVAVPFPGGGVPGPGGGLIIGGPGGGSSGSLPGGGGAVTPSPTPTPTATSPVVPTPTPTTPPVTAVPEPATWFMMIAGFGFVGGALRRRRRLHPA